MHGGEPERERIDVRGDERAGGDALAPQGAVGKAAHAHRDFEQPPGARERRPARPFADLDDVEVEIGCEAPVQAQLLVAQASPLGQRGEVEERQAQRLLELVGVRATEQHPRDRRLDQARRRAVLGRDLGAESLDEIARGAERRLARVGHNSFVRFAGGNRLTRVKERASMQS